MIPHASRTVEPGAPEAADLREAWRLLPPEDRVEGFRALARGDAEDFFLDLSSREQAELESLLPPGERRLWMRLLPPDDAADLIQEADEEERPALLDLLDDVTRTEVLALLAYAEDDAGGLMNPRFARARPAVAVEEAISYLRKQARGRRAAAH